jgi:hypothetical protein
MISMTGARPDTAGMAWPVRVPRVESNWSWSTPVIASLSPLSYYPPAGTCSGTNARYKSCSVALNKCLI